MESTSSPSGQTQEHVSVLPREVLEFLSLDPSGTYVDGTTGMGGHTRLLAARLAPGGRVLALDRDAESLEMARRNLADLPDRITFVRENFKNLPLVLSRLAPGGVTGVLLDLGISSFQLLSPGRGFTFGTDAPLDMRMDQSQRTTAADLVNDLPEEDLANVLYEFGEERRSRAIARRIAEARRRGRLTSSRELVTIVESVLGPKRPGMIHPATRTFQALRIAVNGELEGLSEFLPRLTEYLVPGGRLAVISFHSLEDRIVKNAFQLLEGRCICRKSPDFCICPRVEKVKVLTRKPVTASEEEVGANPRARSAKLRVLERIVEKPSRT